MPVTACGACSFRPGGALSQPLGALEDPPLRPQGLSRVKPTAALTGATQRSCVCFSGGCAKIAAPSHGFLWGLGTSVLLPVPSSSVWKPLNPEEGDTVLGLLLGTLWKAWG